MLSSLFQCVAFVPITVVSFLRVEALLSFNVLLLSHPDVLHAGSWDPGSTLSGI